MKIVVAPNAFKDSLTAKQAAEAISAGVRKISSDIRTVHVPVADGGDGLFSVVQSVFGGECVTLEVKDPLGRPVKAEYLYLPETKTAVIEMARASGLALLKPEERDARATTTYGTGQLVRAALERGAERVIVGIGGSATNDGGMGFARVLGAGFFDASGRELPPGGAALADLASIDLSGLDPRLADVEIRVACDVDNPLCGPRGAAAVFGPQKGASPAQVEQLDAALGVFAKVAAQATGKTAVAETPGAGAAGGLGAGLLYFTGATLMPGVSLVLEAVNFDERVRKADLVFTGEGRTDFQTAYGKAPAGVARAAKKYSLPVVCLSGGIGKGADDVLAQGIDAVFSIAPGPISLQECLDNGEPLLRDAAERVCRLARASAGLKA